mmetsp:Transcript_5929/g.17150  ORF Transcript_5929/g.17150 Transcript_5929/m.17150 type:complete len:612 (+) Transcript_5929:81-1916(+)
MGSSLPKQSELPKFARNVLPKHLSAKLKKANLYKAAGTLTSTPAAQVDGNSSSSSRSSTGGIVRTAPSSEEAVPQHREEPPTVGFRGAGAEGADRRTAANDAAAPAGRELAEGEAQELWQFLFGFYAEEADIERWMSSSFKFEGTSKTEGSEVSEAAECTEGRRRRHEEKLACPWGLRQELGGPCGVLAAVQAFLLRELLWSDNSGSTLTSASSVDAKGISVCLSEGSTTAPSSAAPSSVPSRAPSLAGDFEDSTPVGSSGPNTPTTEAISGEAAATALGEMRADESAAVSPMGSPRDLGMVRVLAERFAAADSRELLACTLVRMMHNAATSSKFVWAEVLSRDVVIRRDFGSARALADWLLDQDVLGSATSPPAPCAVMAFVCSLVLTRGTEMLRSDMDDGISSSPLIGLFGHCSQELTNLCLSGYAVSNVFDGDLSFEDGSDVIVLRGMRTCPPVGFLTALEPLKLCEVGKLLKQPQYPLWVLGSASHYSLLFAEDCCLNHAAPRAGSESPAHGCRACAGHAFAEVRSSRIWHFNGRADLWPSGPTLTPIDVKLVNPRPEYAPASLVNDQDPRLFAEVLRSRWPGAEVTYPLGAGQGSKSKTGGAPRID